MFFLEGNNNARYVVRCESNGDEYKISATDLGRLWVETLTSEEIIARCKAMNPNIEAPPKSLLSRVLHLLDTYDANARATINVTEGHMEIYVETRMSGIVFRFQFDLVLSDISQFMKEVSQPLILIMKELQAKVTHLCELLKKKDVEIEHYKLEGVQIYRKSVETQPFSKEEFEKLYLTKDCQDVQVSAVNMMNADLLKLWQTTSLLHAAKCTEIKTEIKEEADIKVKEEPVSSDEGNDGPNNHLSSGNLPEISKPKVEPSVKLEKDAENNGVEKRKKVLKRKLKKLCS